jgi:hypothetical protein
MQIMQDAIICHLIGDKRFFKFSSDAAHRCVKSSPKAPTVGVHNFVIKLRFPGSSLAVNPYQAGNAASDRISSVGEKKRFIAIATIFGSTNFGHFESS